MKPLKKPHIPEGTVCLCAVSTGQSYIKAALNGRGISTIHVAAHPALPAPVQAHSDLLLHDLGDGLIMVAPGCDELMKRIQSYGYRAMRCGKPLSPQYPNNVLLNCFVLNGVVYCNPDSVAQELLDAYRSCGYTVEAVKQGYTKCSVCILSERAIITADVAIGRAARKNDIDVLIIDPGHIVLPGYSYGFIGGCSGLLGRDALAFTGDVRLHPDGARILAFCRKYSLEAIALHDGPLMDIGGIIPLAENNGNDK